MPRGLLVRGMWLARDSGAEFEALGIPAWGLVWALYCSGL